MPSSHVRPPPIDSSIFVRDRHASGNPALTIFTPSDESHLLVLLVEPNTTERLGSLERVVEPIRFCRRLGGVPALPTICMHKVGVLWNRYDSLMAADKLSKAR
jgi:hypothetical protein